MTRLARLFLLAAVGVAACKDSTAPSIVGSYFLRTINGQSPPRVVAQTQYGTIEITGGAVTLNADHSFTHPVDFRITNGSSVTTDRITALGAWQQAGDNVTFTATDNTVYGMAISGRTLTQVNQGLTLVYRR